MTKTPSIAFLDDEDFGFSFSDTTDEKIQNDDLANRLQMMYDAIIPLLKNLNKNPNQEYIKWPNRTDKINEFKAKLDEIGSTHIKVKKL
jgi:hypothetical protein